ARHKAPSRDSSRGRAAKGREEAPLLLSNAQRCCRRIHTYVLFYAHYSDTPTPTRMIAGITSVTMASVINCLPVILGCSASSVLSTSRPCGSSIFLPVLVVNDLLRSLTAASHSASDGAREVVVNVAANQM